jgi:hypothetical protein
MNPTHTGGSILLRCLITAFLGHLYTPGVFLTNQDPDPIIPPDLLLSKTDRGASATSGAPGLAPVLPAYEGVHNNTLRVVTLFVDVATRARSRLQTV